MPFVSPAANATTITGPLMLGSRGKDVQTLQSLLNKATIPGPGLNEDRAFGIKTEAAVRNFQRRNGLKPDGIAGLLTAQALGVKFVPQPQPPPKPDPSGTFPPATTLTSQVALLRVIASGMKSLFQSIEIVLDGVGDEFSEAANRARKFAKFGLNQCLFLLSTAAQDRLSAPLTANQTRVALLEYFRNLGVAAGELERAGVDASGIFDIMDDLNARIPPTVETVRKTLEGQIDGGLREGISILRNLMDR
jgi:hypothetical protein